MLIDCICKGCGKPFQVEDWVLKAGGGQHCSRACRRRRITIPCLWCSKSFETFPCRLKSGGGRFCSSECYGLHKRRRIACICRQCGEAFEAHPSAIKRGGGQFCSKKCSGLHSRRPIADRFQAFLGPPQPNGCRLWLGDLSNKGYGQIREDGDGKLLLAHRVSWELQRGPIPEGLWVLHNCPGGDNPACSEISHLWLGNRSDNMLDMYQKGRGRGQPNHHSLANKNPPETPTDG